MKNFIICFFLHIFVRLTNNNPLELCVSCFSFMKSFIKTGDSLFDPKSMKLAADDPMDVHVVEITIPEASLSKHLSTYSLSQSKVEHHDDKCFEQFNTYQFSVTDSVFESKTYTIPLDISKLIVQYQTKVIIISGIKFDVLVEAVKYLKHYHCYSNDDSIKNNPIASDNDNDEKFDKDYLNNLAAKDLLSNVNKACMSDMLDIKSLQIKTGHKMTEILFVSLFGGYREDNTENDDSDDAASSDSGVSSDGEDISLDEGLAPDKVIHVMTKYLGY